MKLSAFTPASEDHTSSSWYATEQKQSQQTTAKSVYVVSLLLFRYNFRVEDIILAYIKKIPTVFHLALPPLYPSILNNIPVLVLFFLSTLNRVHALFLYSQFWKNHLLFQCFHCWLWTNLIHCSSFFIGPVSLLLSK